MKKLLRFSARLFILALALIAGSSGQVAAQELVDGYYYITRSNSNGLYLRYPGENPASDMTWRIQEHTYLANPIPNKEDRPYIFKVTKQDDGLYQLQNLETGMYIAQHLDKVGGYGGGLGMLETPGAGYQITYNELMYGWNLQEVNAADQPIMMSWGDGYASYCWGYQIGLDDSKAIWTFEQIDDQYVENMQEPEVVEGSLESGYYIINLPDYDIGNVYMCAAPDENMNYRPQCDIIDDVQADYDPAFIFHVTKLDNGNYRIKNMGKQNDTYIEPYVYGDHSTPNVFMSGNKNAEQRIEFLSTGRVYIYTAGQNFRYHLNPTTAMVETGDYANVYSSWKFIKVDDSRVTPELKLQEAITDAKGGNYQAGSNPGQVPEAALTAFNEVISEAEAAVSAGVADLEAMVGKINAAVEEIEAQKVPLTEGYYRFVNQTHGDYLIPYWTTQYGETGYWLWHGVVDELDPMSYWHVMVTPEGEYVMKNCGIQEYTYIKGVAEGDAWGLVKVTGTSQTTQSFVQKEGNLYKIFSSGNLYPYNADGSGLVSNNKDYYAGDGYWYIEKVSDEEVGVFMKLNEAITDAKGLMAETNVGPNPGQNAGDTTAIAAAIKSATDMYNEGVASDADIDQMIAQLKTAQDEFAAQDHSMNPVTDGYYYILAANYTWYDATIEGNRTTAMYTTNNSQLKWGLFEEKTPDYLFKITDNGNGTFSVQNVKYLNYVGTYSQADLTVMMTAEPQVGQTFKYLERERWSISNTTDNVAYNLQTYGHDTGGSIRLADGDANSNAAWLLVKLTDQQLIDSIVQAGAQDGITQQMRNALVQAEPAYKNVMKYTVDHENGGLITEVNETDPLSGQVWASQEPAAVNDGYSSYANLIDGSTASCFQSTWDANVATPPQPFQVDLRDNPVSDFEFYFGLRDGDWGFKEMWTDVSLYVTNDPSVAAEPTVDESKWTYIGRYTDFPTSEFEQNYAGSNRGFYYRITDMGGEYRYLRFLVNSTYEPQANMMYTIGEFQVYEAILDEENSPYNYVPGLKEAADNLKALIDDAKAKIETNTVKQEEVDAILAATQIVLDMTPDTEPLENLISEVQSYVGKFGYDDQYGDVTGDQYDDIMIALKDAADYDHEKPLRADLDAKVAALQAAFDLYKSQQKQFEPNKWYYIYNTDITRAGSVDQGTGTGDIYQSLVNGSLIIAPESNNTKTAHWDGNADAVIWGAYDYATDERDPNSYTNPYCMWRLVDITEDGADHKVYALQNRATGQYLASEYNDSQRMGMSATPTPFFVELLKSGQYRMYSDVKENINKKPLHASGDGYVVPWAGDADSPSSWTFEEVPEDIKNLYVDIPNNSIQIMSLPYALDEATVDYNISIGIFLYGIKGIAADGSELYLKSLTSTQAGEPFIVVANDYTSFNPEAGETVQLALPLADDFIYEGKTVNGLIATMDYTVPGRAGYGIFVDSALDSTAVDTGINGQGGYINTGLIISEEGESDLTITIKDGLLNDIKTVVVNEPDEKVDVYTIDGVLVKKNVVRSEATEGLAKGIYIVGKDKVLVK